MINDDLLPANHQSCAILAALDTLQQAGINAALSIDADVYQITLRPTEPASDLTNAVLAAQVHRLQTQQAVQVVTQAKRGRRA